MFNFRVQYRLKSVSMDVTAEITVYAKSSEAAADKAAEQLQRQYPDAQVTIRNVTQITFGYF